MSGTVSYFDGSNWVKLEASTIKDPFNYGYIFSFPLDVGEGYELLRPREIIQEDDSYWSMDELRWKDYAEHDREVPVGYKFIGTPVQPHLTPARRRLLPPRWQCGHGRDTGAPHCQVCAVVYFRKVID